MDTDLNIDSNTLVVSYDDDRVGIGTNAPTNKLEVAGNVTIQKMINSTSGDFIIRLG